MVQVWQSPRKRRVVVTGLGAVTPIGVGIEQYWAGLLAGRSGVGPITLFDPADYPSRIAAEVKDFDSSRFFDRRKAKLLARSAQFGVAAALLCLEDADWAARPGDGRLAVAGGISNSARDIAEKITDAVREHGYHGARPHWLTMVFPHCAASETGLLTGFQNQVMTFATACTAGANAIGYAAEEIRAGRAEAFLCTSTDSTITECSLACFCRANMVSVNNGDPVHASRPYDAKRDGGVLGEGAGCLLLESDDHARRRGASVYAEVLGFGTSGVGYSDEPAASVSRGMSAAMAQALASAGCGPARIDYVGCHGVSDVNLDVWETRAVKDTFGEHAYRVPLSSVKSMIGIPQNAAGVLQLIAAIMAIKEGAIPPTTNYEFQDPLCDLDYVPNTPRRNAVRRALVLTHGFNGSDAALVVGRPDLP